MVYEIMGYGAAPGYFGIRTLSDESGEIFVRSSILARDETGNYTVSYIFSSLNSTTFHFTSLYSIQ